MRIIKAVKFLHKDIKMYVNIKYYILILLLGILNNQ